MTNSSMPNLPGFGTIAETMELVRNMWGGATAPGIGIPGMVMPTLSVEEINKQISDLKAVESWLTLNMNMLRGTIQALEVQSATISTLKSMGETLSASVKAAGTPAPAAKPASGSAQGATAGGSSSASGNATPSMFSFPFGSTSAPASEPAARTPEPESRSAAQPAETGGWGQPADAGNRSAPGKPDDSAEAPASKSASKQSAAGDAAFGTPLANPAAWWNMLQDQFKQAVSTAMAGEGGAGPGKNTGKAGAGSAAADDAKAAGRATAKSGSAAKKTTSGTAARSAKSATKPAARSTAKTAVKVPSPSR